MISEKKTNQIKIEPKGGGAGCYHTITQKEGFVLVDFYCGC
jgi:hypothetical protein